MIAAPDHLTRRRVADLIAELEKKLREIGSVAPVDGRLKQVAATMPTSEQKSAKFPSTKGGLIVDRDFLWGAVLFSFLFLVGYALQRAEPVPLAIDQAKIMKSGGSEIGLKAKEK